MQLNVIYEHVRPISELHRVCLIERAYVVHPWTNSIHRMNMRDNWQIDTPRDKRARENACQGKGEVMENLKLSLADALNCHDKVHFVTRLYIETSVRVLIRLNFH